MTRRPSSTYVHEIPDDEIAYVELACRRQGRFVRWFARRRLHQQYRRNPVFRSMLMDEARLGALVHHPNVVSVLDFGVDDAGPFMIMELVDGLPLSRVMADAVIAGLPIPVQVGVRICMEAAKGLHAAHEVRAQDETVVGLVHGDLSPKNILIAYDGAVQVADFGTATAFAMFDGGTERGGSKLRLDYRAPEVSRFQEYDRRSDIYSLGLVLSELTTGTGPGGSAARQPVSEINGVRGNIPSELHELLAEMLAPDADRRPATAWEIGWRLEAILATLIAEEGLRTVGDHMARHFAREQEEQRASLVARLKEIDVWGGVGL